MTNKKITNTIELTACAKNPRTRPRFNAVQIKIIEMMVFAYDNQSGVFMVDLIACIFGEGNPAFRMVKRRVLMKQIELMNARKEGWSIGHYRGSTQLFLNFSKG